MNVEIINVGTELLLGEIVNTNATVIQKACKELGFSVYYQTVVGDNPDRFLSCLDMAFSRGANIVITTGGLGPTADDLTKELSASYLGLEMVYDENEAKKVYDKCAFVMTSEDVPSTNFKQAYFPENCFILENEVGTANGCVMSKDEKRIVNLPGPPKEMEYVLTHSLLPYLEPYKKQSIYTHNLTTMFIGESDMALRLQDIIDQQVEVSIALYASEDFCRVRFGVQASHQEEADQKMAPIIHVVEDILKDYIVEENDLKLALYQMMPPYHIHYHCPDFRLREGFVLGKERGLDFIINIAIEKHDLGEKVIIDLNYKNKTSQFVVGMLKAASLSPTRLESRIVANVYKFLKSL